MSKLAVYIKEITLKDIKCFEGYYNVSLAGNNNYPYQWTVLLGNNNAGKTTFLRAVSELQAIPFDKEKSLRSLTNNNYDNSFIPQASSWHKNSPINPKIKKGVSREISMELLMSTYDPSLKLKQQVFEQKTNSEGWYFRMNEKDGGGITIDLEGEFANLIMYGYGALRRRSENSLVDNQQDNTTASLFSDHVTLLNVEDWLLKTSLAYLTGEGSIKEIARKRIEKIKELFVSELFPDIYDFQIVTDDQLDSYVEFSTGYSWVSLSSLGYGYQNSIIWIVDFAKRMFDRYPDLDNPLHGPAIVLVDEIDLHLHPEWQRKIIKYLSDLFPNTQFIVTAHSPLIVQSAENVNLIMLEKDDETGSINIRQQFGSFQGWTVEEILRELMDMGEKTRSDRYLELMRQFEDGLLAEDYIAVKTAYEELDKILSPSSHQRKVLQIQMSSLIPA